MSQTPPISYVGDAENNVLETNINSPQRHHTNHTQRHPRLPGMLTIGDAVYILEQRNIGNAETLHNIAHTNGFSLNQPLQSFLRVPINNLHIPESRETIQNRRPVGRASSLRGGTSRTAVSREQSPTTRSRSPSNNRRK